MLVIILIIALASLTVTIISYQKMTELTKSVEKQLEDNADNLSDQLTYQIEAAQKDQILTLTNQLNRMQQEIYQLLTDMRTELNQHLTESR
ncbi:DNA recombination protein RmuC, partial [Streptococcus agalactiae]